MDFMAISQTSAAGAANLYALTDAASGSASEGATNVQGVAMLSKAVDIEKTQTSQILAMLVPNLGQNVDLRI
ncbi:MAG: hypothetical protein JWQ02_556 [Capsulimonas sp.]|jgi:hypothetical protein|nr:hypothetical protein [Capsulimonas sp.]